MKIGFKNAMRSLGKALLTEVAKELQKRVDARQPSAPVARVGQPTADGFDAAPNRGVTTPNIAPTRPAFEMPNRAPVFTGFDAQKLASDLKLQPDGQPKSAKYTFAKLAQAAGKMPQSKEESEQWFKNYIQPGMEAAGFQVDWVKGDKAMIHTRENPQGEEVDFVRGAGSNDPNYIALAWQPTGVMGDGRTAPTGGGGGGVSPLGSLSTVPMLPEYQNAPIDKSSIDAAIKSAAQWVKDRHPEWFQGDDRQVAFKVMTEVIGALRAAGFDAHRVVNHPSRAVGDGWRYGSDALVLNGRIFDVYAGMGDPNMSRPQALDVGPYEAGRLRE